MAATEAEIVDQLGPLAPLAGTWEGAKGDDTAPADQRDVPEKTPFRERITFVPFGPVNNHDQTLWGLRYTTTAWPVGQADAFHEETGYWLWDPRARHVMRAFLVPRGVTVLAGGVVEPTARTFRLAAEVGSPTFGICSNPFLDAEFRTIRYDLVVTLGDDGSFSYEEDTVMLMKGRSQLFHHVDKNTLTRV
jgi:hypothetical protein